MKGLKKFKISLGWKYSARKSIGEEDLHFLQGLFFSFVANEYVFVLEKKNEIRVSLQSLKSSMLFIQITFVSSHPWGH